MTVPSVHSGSLVVLDDTSDTILGGITQMSLPTNTEVEKNAKSGEAYHRHQSIVSIKPALSYTTKSLDTHWAAIGWPGLDISSLATGLVAYQVKHADGGVRTAGSNHRSYTMAHGILFPQSLAAQHGSAATMDYNTVITYDGTNVPVVPAGSVALPTAPSETEYALGPCTIANEAITGIESLNLDFGITAEGLATDGDVYDTHAGILVAAPMLSITTVNVAAFGASTPIPLVGLNGTHANTAIYLRKRSNGGIYTANATAEHCKITLAGIVHIDSAFESTAEGGQRTTTTINMHAYYDSTNAPVVMSFTNALP